MTMTAKKNSAATPGMHSGPDGVEAFRCPGCDSTVAVDLRPTGAYPWPPHYVCPVCDSGDDAPASPAPVAAKPTEPPPAVPAVADEPVKEQEEELPVTEHHRQTQRQLALLQEDGDPQPE